MQSKLLIVDDDRELLKMLKYYFEYKGYMIILAEDGIEALEKISHEPDLILLDINMPRINGIELCKKIRNIIMCPILFLTGRTTEQDIINGLLSGGDDYIGKPFSLKELEARIVSHLKREERRTGKTKLKINDNFQIDYLSQEVCISGNVLELTKIEYAIVEFLVKNIGRVFDKERLYEAVSGFDAEGDSRVITELIRRIRNKIKQYSEREYIETVWGCGYRWKK